MATISIITTVLNGSATIRECLQSVGEQEIPVEHIIIDGGSTDGTLDIIEQHRPYLAKVISEKDDGLYAGMNKGIKLATGDVLGILNADDTYADTTVLKKVATTFDDLRVESCYGDLVYVDSNNNNRITRVWKAGDYHYRRFYWGWMPPHPTFFVGAGVYKKHGIFNLSLGSAADYELMLRFLMRHRITTAYIPEVLVKMRTGGTSNASLKNRLTANRMDRMAWTLNGLKPYPWTTYLKPLRKMGQFLVRSYP
jgi:glycosyltransferase involved in cell wall biosynthesis